MSFLLALAAFAAIVTVYSTVVTVIVEGLQKVLALRSAGMNEMLRAFYDQTLTTLQPDDMTASAQAKADTTSKAPSNNAKQFADSITRRTPSESLKFWYIRKWPLIGHIFASRRTNLTTLQFIESLAETKEGAALARHRPDRLRGALTTAAYQYERLGETQSAYFRSRAKLISVIVGMVVAVFINFDAITVYKELSTNAALSSRLTLAMDQEKLNLVQKVAGGDESQMESSSLMTPAIQQAAGDLRALGIPIGRKMFPHCEGYSHTASNDASVIAANAPKEAIVADEYFDSRCGKSRQQTVNLTWSQTFGEYLSANNAQPEGWMESAGYWLQYRGNRIGAIGRNLQSFLLWALGIVVAGGLLGLGAPFWFKIFGRLSSMAIPAARATMATPANSPAGPVMVTASQVRPAGSSDPEDLERGFLTVINKGKVLVTADEAAADAIGTLDEAPRGKRSGVRPPESEQT